MGKKIVVFGSLSLTTRCLRHLRTLYGVDVIGVCCVPMDNSWRSGFESDFTYDYCLSENIKILKHVDLPELNPELGISICYDKILPTEILNLFPRGVINAHGGLLPSYGGNHSNIHAILNGDDAFGVTLHYMDGGIDSGDIIDRIVSPILDEDTGFTLLGKTEELLFAVYKRNIEEILYGVPSRTAQTEFPESRRYYKKADIEDLMYIPVDKLANKESLNIIRAFDSPIHMCAYTIIGNRKITLRFQDL